MPEKTIIIGASSGIGHALATLLIEQGHEVGVVARRLDKLEELKALAPERVSIGRLDVQELDRIGPALDGLIEQLGGVDWVVYCAGLGTADKGMQPGPMQATVLTNAAGFVAVFGHVVQRMRAQGHGLIAGVSSVMEARGTTNATTYAATKAFMSRFMEGARPRARRWNVDVCDIRPGFVRTAMTEGVPGTFGMVEAPVAARLILTALHKKRVIAYIPGWWRVFGFALRHAPGWLLRRVGI